MVFLFEVIFPMLKKGFEGDGMDLLFFGSGMMFYMVFMNSASDKVK